MTKYIPDSLQDLLEVWTTKKDKISKVNLDALHKPQLSSWPYAKWMATTLALGLLPQI